MERRNLHIRSLEATLEQAPKVLQPIGMAIPVHVLNGMVYDLMEEFAVEPVIGCQRIGVEGSASLHAALNQALQGSLLAVGDYRCGYRATALKESHDRCFVFPARAVDCGFALFLVHIPSLPADEG